MRVRRRSNEPTARKHVILYEGDWEELERLYPKHSPSAVIRNLVRGLIRRNESLANSAQNEPPLEIALDELDHAE